MLRPNYPRGPYTRPFDELLKGKENLVGAEVGVYRGQHAREMLTYLDIEKLLLVDFWDDYDTYNEGTLKAQLVEAYEDAKKLLSQFDSKKLVWIKKASVEAAKEIEDNSLDFVYIDANHAYDYALQDINAWLPKIKDGGFIGGHDYDNNREKIKTTGAEYGVQKAVKEYCGEHNIKFKFRPCLHHPTGEMSVDWAFKKGGEIDKWPYINTLKFESFKS